ncbi:hypothetical protein P43SY_008153 [Pythium insidiosum]|uniref:DNA repair protein Crb2 Tudor domain-containing protein n=1 Tax=Pythium insidiosum TaxID=114742 RepID=A0AAD5LHT5_PYTIN|nr:hypothetical protein P43SY_008153 [Pythium insidiosum]
MSDFSSTTRLWATLLLVLLSIGLWKWLRAPPSSGVAAAAGRSASSGRKKPKKRSNKRSAKAKRVETEEDALPAEAAEPKDEDASASSSDDSDADAGRSAAKVLASRHFKPRAIGGGGARPPAVEHARRFQVQQRVLARFQGGEHWFPGTIVEVRRGNEYHVQYDDGELEYHVAAALIKDAAKDAQAESDDHAQGAVPAVGGSGSDSPRERSSSELDDDDDGWQVVRKGAKRGAGSAGAGAGAGAAPEEVGADGLTKRQRESRRKRERKKELKELVRAQAQEDGLHARWGGSKNKMTYVPPPTQQQQQQH